MSIIALSLFMNFLVLPLYMRADTIQEEEHALERKLQEGVDYIKKTFSGDERMMILQTYYRQNHYKPVYVLRSAVSLFLQIPFFIAAYRFLSGLSLLNGVPFGPIVDLARPDGLLRIGGANINILPFVMTAAYGYLVRRPPILWKMFFGGAVFLAILTGVLIPSAVIGASPLEFVQLTHFYDPLWYVAGSACLAFDIFVVWLGVFYFLAKPAKRAYFDKAIWIFAGVSLLDHMFFGKDLGLLSTELTYEKGVEFGRTDQLKNIVVLVGAAVIFWVAYR